MKTFFKDHFEAKNFALLRAYFAEHKGDKDESLQLTSIYSILSVGVKGLIIFASWTQEKSPDKRLERQCIKTISYVPKLYFFACDNKSFLSQKVSRDRFMATFCLL